MTSDDEALYDEDGRRVGHLAPDDWSVPDDVDLVDGWLVPVVFDTLELRQHPIPPPKPDALMLRRFADLADLADEVILEYARSWGMLGLCAHGLGRFHDPLTLGSWNPRWANGACKEPPDAFRLQESATALGRRRWYFEAERVADWRGVSGQVRDVLARIVANTPTTFRAWHAATTPEIPPDRQDLATFAVLGFAGSDEGRWWWQCGDYVKRLLRDAGVRPTIEWDHPLSGVTEDDLLPRPRVALGAHSLLGALAVQVLYMAAGGGGDAIRCDGCGQWYSPRRRTAGLRSWCPACRSSGRANRHYAELKRTRDRATRGEARAPARLGSL